MAKYEEISPPPSPSFINQPPSYAESLHSEEVVMDCLSMLAASVHLDTAIDSFLETLGCYYDAEGVFLFQTNTENEVVSCSFVWPTPIVNTTPCPRHCFEPWLTAFDAEGLLSLSSSEDPRLEPLTPFCGKVPSSALAIPMYTDTLLSGFLCVVAPRQHFADLKVLLAVANLCVVELRKLNLMAQLDYLHQKDPLTDVYNRFSYVSSLAMSSQPPPSSMGVIIASVNGLKRVNQALGISFGDSIVQQTAETMKTALSCPVYRISGDEFASLHPNLDEATFRKVVETLHAAFDTDTTCSVSVGSAWSDCEIDAHTLFSQADQELTEKKKAASTAAFSSVTTHF